MSRLTKRTVILLKVETTVGVDASPSGANNAMQVFNMSVTPLDSKNINLNLIYPYLGNSPSLVGPGSKRCTFSVYAAGSGTAATAPAWGAALTVCANSETTGLTTPNRVEYAPASDTLKTATIYYEDDGVTHKLLGSFGNVKFSAKGGEAPMYTFDFVALDGGEVAQTNDSATLTAWKLPVPIKKGNVTDINFGCTYAAGVLTGGTSYNSSGLNINWGNTINFTPLLTTETVDIDDRKMVGSTSLELTAAQEVSMMTSIKANTLQSMGFVIGTATGNKLMLHAPSVQIVSMKPEEVNGKRMFGCDLKFMPTSGNDELRIVHL